MRNSASENGEPGAMSALSCKSIPPNKASQILEAAIGLPVSYFWRDAGTLFISFGALTKKARPNHPQGEFEFMLTSPYRFLQSGALVCSWHQSAAERDSFLSRLEGSTLSKIAAHLSPPSFKFSLGSISFVSGTRGDRCHDWTVFVSEDKYSIGSSNFALYAKGQTFEAEGTF